MLSNLLRGLLHGATSLGDLVLALLTARSVVVVSTTCAILYAAFWTVGLLQANGLISTALPIAVADSVILRRSGAELHSAAAGPGELAQRQRALAQAQTASATGESDPTASRITLEVQTAPPVDLWVFDDANHAVGTNPQNGLVRLQIPQAAYSGKGTNPQLVSIPHATGTYHIQLVGRGTGHFELRVRAFLDQDVTNATEYAGNGDIFQDTLLQTELSVALADDGTPQIGVSSVRVVLAGDVPAPSPSPSTSPQPSPSASEQPSVSPAGQVAGAQALPPTLAPPAPLARVVFRPRPVVGPPIPLPPLPLLPSEPAAQGD